MKETDEMEDDGQASVSWPPFALFYPSLLNYTFNTITFTMRLPIKLNV